MQIQLHKASVRRVQSYYRILDKIGFADVLTKTIGAAQAPQTAFGAISDQVEKPLASNGEAEIVINVLGIVNAIWTQNCALEIAQVIFRKADGSEVTDEDLDDISIEEFVEGISFFGQASLSVMRGVMSLSSVTA